MTHIPSFNNRREHLLFPRQQSRTMQEQEWETRMAMPEPWVKVIGGLIGWVVFAVTGFWLAGVMAKVMHG